MSETVRKGTEKLQSFFYTLRVNEIDFGSALCKQNMKNISTTIFISNFPNYSVFVQWSEQKKCFYIYSLIQNFEFFFTLNRREKWNGLSQYGLHMVHKSIEKRLNVPNIFH